MSCLTNASLTMTASVLHQRDADTTDDLAGEWVESQDPYSGDIVRVWQPGDDPDTPDVEVDTVSCDVRPFTTNTRGFGGNVESFGKEYAAEDYARMKFPANVIITKRDRVTNIRNRNGQFLWLEEEMDKEDGSYRATVFDVLGVIPVIGPFGEHMANAALLCRTEIQD